MSEEKRGELLFSIFFALIGIISIVIIENQAKLSINPTDPTNVSTFPSVWGALLVLFSLVNVVIIFLSSKKRATADDENKEKSEGKKKQERLILIRVIAIFALLIGFTLLLKKVYFTILVFIFLLISFRIFGQRKHLVNLIVSLIGAAFVHVIFIVFLKIPI